MQKHGLRGWALAGLLLCGALQAAEWQEARVTYLKGDNYRVGEPSRQVLTFEHAMARDWGDSFFFLDHMKMRDGSHSNYAEWQPRLSFGKLAGWSSPTPLVKDLLLATQVEMSSQRTNLLYGVGFDLAIPGLKFTQLNLYRRDNEQIADNWQATLVWGLPLRWGGQKFLYDGFIDWASGSSDQHANVNVTSQFKWRLSELWQGKQAVWLGVEYVWWRHKFGIIDSPGLPTHESNMNVLLKIDF